MIRRQTPLPDPPLPLLITGIAGVAGYNAFHYFRRRYGNRVVGIRPTKNWPLREAGICPCDLEDADQLARLFDQHAFAGVLDCAGSCKLKSCELDPVLAWRVNVLGVRGLLDRIVRTGARLVHLSIDLVYSGSGSGGHVETDPTDPVTVYGQTMAAAETLIRLAVPAACILRISLPMGVSFNGHAGAIDWIQARFQKQKPATLYYDEIRTPTYVDCLNRVCRAALASRLAGIYHAGGPRRLSLYQIAQIVNRVGGYDPELLHGCYRQEAGPVPPRAGNVTLNSDRLAKSLGFTPFAPWPYWEEHVPTGRHWHRQHRGGQSGCPELLAAVLYRRPAAGRITGTN